MIDWDERTWFSLYRTDDRGEVFTYGRRFYADRLALRFEGRMKSLLSLGMAQGDRALVVGCAYGFLIETLIDEGIDAYGVDSSPYIFETIEEQARPDVRARITHGRCGPDLGLYDWVVDEDAANSHADEELHDFYSALESCVSKRERVVHFVTPGLYGDSSINWKSFPDWVATEPSHQWINVIGS